MIRILYRGELVDVVRHLDMMLQIIGSSLHYVAEEIRLASLVAHNDYKHSADETAKNAFRYHRHEGYTVILYDVHVSKELNSLRPIS